MTLDGTFCRQGRQVDTFKRLTWQIAKQVGRLSFLAAFGINSTASPSSPAQIKSWDDFWENWGETNLPWLSCAGPSNIGVDRETEITDRRPQIKTGEGGSQRWRTGRKFKQIFLNLSRDLFTSRYSLILQAAGHPRFGSKAWPHKSPARKDQRLVPDELTPPTWTRAMVASTRWCGNSWINAAIIREFPPRRNCPGNLEFGAKMWENPKACPKNKSLIYERTFSIKNPNV